MAESSAFDLLHHDVQKWIWSRQWTQLRDAQERAVAPILAGDRDVVIAAATASGKTEAAFLPICSALLDAGPAEPGVQALYISPLKALINDQYNRLDDLCEQTGLAVHRWHGDVPGSRKHKMLADPSGLLLITPESLEALFVVHGPKIPQLFSALRYIVIDEVHTFIGTERGAQLRSLAHRIELATRRHIPRIGLSATLGDMAQATDWLRPKGGDRVEVIEADDPSAEIKLQVRGYIETPPESGPSPAGSDDAQDDGDETTTGAILAIGDHLFKVHRGQDGLIFANSRARVELLTDLLSRRSRRERVPDEFVPHHGNLSRELREYVEARLKERATPVTAVCTSTLEMGIDIGSVACVSQIGPPPAVSTLRQRLGRSGRRGEAAVLRAYVSEPVVTAKGSLCDELRIGLAQTIAMVELLLARWCEPSDDNGLHLSTLVQQLLSVIAQHGGVKPQEAYSALCGHGPFEKVSATTFAATLRSLARHDIIMQQASDGLLLLGVRGERIVNHYSFYAAFSSPEEYRLMTGSRVLGTLPIGFPLQVGNLIIFAGRRWKIVAIDDRGKTIELVRSSGGRVQPFDGGFAGVHDVVRLRMRGVYLESTLPNYLDQTARDLLVEGRGNFARRGLSDKAVVAAGKNTHLFVWRGDRVVSTIAIALTGLGLEVARSGPVLTISADVQTVAAAVRSLAAQEAPVATELARQAGNKVVDKWDEYLDDPLLDLACGLRDLDVDTAWSELSELGKKIES